MKRAINRHFGSFYILAAFIAVSLLAANPSAAGSGTFSNVQSEQGCRDILMGMARVAPHHNYRYYWDPNSKICTVTTEDQPASCRDIVGRWIWHTGLQAEYFNNNTWRQLKGPAAGTWRCRGTKEIEIKFNEGPWVDTVTISRGGGNLSGRNQEGARVSATRMLP